MAGRHRHGRRDHVVPGHQCEREDDQRTWTLAGSSDRLTWNVVDSRSDERFTGPRQTRTFDVVSSAAYSAYRLTVRGGSPSGKVSIATIALAGAGFDTADSKIIADYLRALDPAVGMQHLTTSAPDIASFGRRSYRRTRTV